MTMVSVVMGISASAISRECPSSIIWPFAAFSACHPYRRREVRHSFSFVARGLLTNVWM
jgi:hypothetical protein